MHLRDITDHSFVLGPVGNEDIPLPLVIFNGDRIDGDTITAAADDVHR